MWKYTIIAAVVLLLGASFFLYQHNGALTSPNGEVAAFQKEFQAAAAKAGEVELDKSIQKYAELRAEYMRAQAEDYKSKIAAAQAETESVTQECVVLTSRIDALRAAANAASETFNQFRTAAMTAAEMDGSEVDDSDDFRVAIISKLAEADAANKGTSDKVAAEDAATAALQAETKDTIDKIAAAKKLASDRMARLSPPELECSVQHANADWDYVILDAGINKGIISGSRLTVTRGNRKICELNVTLVESAQSSCEVVAATMRPGDRVMVGDKVTAPRIAK